jgi:hypothetical protein
MLDHVSKRCDKFMNIHFFKHVKRVMATTMIFIKMGKNTWQWPKTLLDYLETLSYKAIKNLILL